MYHVTNFITFLRGPLALLFLFKNPYIRILAIALALFTDIIDGYLARRFNQISKFGAILDPLMDKFFVYTALFIFYLELSITKQQALMMISRDLCVLLVGLIFCAHHGLKNIQFQSILSGKITTGLQFITLFSLCFKFCLPNYFYYSFLLILPCILFELFVSQKNLIQDKL